MSVSFSIPLQRYRFYFNKEIEKTELKHRQYYGEAPSLPHLNGARKEILTRLAYRTTIIKQERAKDFDFSLALFLLSKCHGLNLTFGLNAFSTGPYLAISSSVISLALLEYRIPTSPTE